MSTRAEIERLVQAFGNKSLKAGGGHSVGDRIMCDEDARKEAKADLMSAIDSLLASEAAARKDAERFQLALDDPYGFAHLCRLLQDGKGDEISFRYIIDRIQASQALDVKTCARKRKERIAALEKFRKENPEEVIEAVAALEQARKP